MRPSRIERDVHMMNYLEVKEKLEASKLELVKKLQNPNLTKDEYETIKKSIDNYDYIIELTDMNHFERGAIVH
jgi:L-lactate utilization protein LutB